MLYTKNPLEYGYTVVIVSDRFLKHIFLLISA